MITPAELVVGRVSGAYGIKGWVRIYSYTDPVDSIIDYAPWQLVRGRESRDIGLEEWRAHGKGIVVRFEGVTDRNAAELLKGFEIRVPKARLPELEGGDYYWHELEGLAVVNDAGLLLGVVSHLIETGANDVLVVKPNNDSIDDRERMIPFVDGEMVEAVDLDAREIRVKWSAEY